MECVCVYCKKKFIPKTKNRPAKYCSFVCNGKSTGFKNGHKFIGGEKGWIKKGQRLSPKTEFQKKSGKWKTAGGYIRLYMPNHPSASKDGSVLEHRVVLENKVGRLLNRNEIAHHINGIKTDNRPDNLELMAWGEHTRHHMRKNK